MVRKLLLCCSLVVVSLPLGAAALTLDTFDCITDNSFADCEAGTAQLSGTLVDVAVGEALLTINNDGSEDLVVARIYIESELIVDLLLGDFEDGLFAIGGAPPVLPGGGQTFEVSFSATAEPAPPKNGIGPGESGELLLLLEDGADARDLIDDLRIGVHVIAFDSGGSESFAARPIPEPTSAALAITGLAGLTLLGRAQRARRSR